MSNPLRLPAGAPLPRRRLAVEWLLRSVAIVVYLAMLAGIVAVWQTDTSRHTLLLLLATEGYTLALVVFSRVACTRDASPVAIVATAYASGHFAFYDYQHGAHLIAEDLASAAQIVGLLGQWWAKATLGRAFGVLPAARGLVTRGPYRLVRHPVYLAYLIGNIAFLLANASWRNLFVFALLMLAQVTRMMREEAALERSVFGAAYRAYRSRVRYRIVPHVF